MLSNGQIMIIDPDLENARWMAERLSEEMHCDVEVFGDKQAGIDRGVMQEYDIYFLELSMLDEDRPDALTFFHQAWPESICIVMSENPSIDRAVKTGRLGAYYFLTKPFNETDLSHLVKRALERRWYILESRRLRREKEAGLKEIAHEKTRLKSIVNAIDDGIMVVNPNLELAFFNPRVIQLLDITDAVKVGQSIRELIPADLTQSLERFGNESCREQTIRQELTIKAPAKLIVMANTTPICDADGHLIGIVSVLRDISEMKQAELEKSQFVHMLAHELKAPLAAIEGYLDMVINQTLGDDPELYDNYLKRSLERSRSMREMINDLLNIYRLESVQRVKTTETVDLAEVLTETIHLFETEIARQDVKVMTKLSGNLMTEADREDVQRVFSNLISNAVKYNHYGGEVYIWGRQEGNYVCITIQDTGIGMTDTEQHRLFEAFFRAKNAYTRNVSGTGLGLSIVKRIMDDLAGKITVESQFQKGTKFTLCFPAPSRQISI